MVQLGEITSDQLKSLSPEQQRALLSKLLQEKSQKVRFSNMSAGQQGLWHAFRRNQQSTAFNVFLPTRIRSPLDLDRLRQALQLLSQRHASLRTTFSDAGGKLTQQVQANLPPGFSVKQMRGASEAVITAELTRQALQPFDLEQGPLLRLDVLQISESDFVVLAQAHHIVVDFWSLVLLLGELRIAYPALVQGQDPKLPAAENNYAAFVHAQERMLASSAATRHQDYWQRTVQAVPPVVELPTDRIRPTSFTGRAAVAGLSFAPQVGARILQLASGLRATPFAVIQAALQILIARCSGQHSFFIGSPFSGRSHSEYEQTVGFFVNVLPIQADLTGDPSFRELVTRTSRTLLEALEHEAYPISAIVNDSNTPRDPSRSPLFQVSCTFEKSQVREETGRAGFLFPNATQAWEFGGIKQESFYLPHPTCHYDLEFIFELAGDQLQGMICYCRDLFDEDSMGRLATIFEGILAAALELPHLPLSELPWTSSIVSQAPRPTSGSLETEISNDRTNPQPQLPEVASGMLTVHEQIESITRRQPDAEAFRIEGQTTTYAELSQKAGCLAARLSGLGVGIGEHVPVCCGSGPLALIAALGVQLAGAAVVPVDAAQPAVAAADLLQDVGARVLVVDDDITWQSAALPRIRIDSLGDDSPTALDSIQPEPEAAGPQDLAYIVYTSGSTGRPKGVMVEHAAVCNTLNWRAAAVPLNRDDRVLMLLSHQFDAGLGVAWTTLTQGACLVWADNAARRDPEQLIEQIIRDRITVLPAVPSLLKIIVGHQRFKECKSLRYVWTGGEPMPATLPAQIHSSSQALFWNFYGPTEAAIEATACELRNHDAARLVPIGHPISGAEVLILDERNRPVPDTMPGQIAIGGRGLARGYLNLPELTDRSFIAHPMRSGSQERVYLTGDRGRRKLDGTIEFFGRTDHQVKIRGYRIELGEIEAVMEQHPWVDRASVKIVNPDQPSAQLLGFASLHQQAVPASVDAGECACAVREFLAERLPAYKLPAAMAIVETMPLTSSGKVDRKRLPERIAESQRARQVARPVGSLEEFLHAAWADVLGKTDLDVHQNFFDAGGSSLQAAMLTTKLTEELAVHVPTALIFDLATIRQMARRLVQLHRSPLVERFGEGLLGEAEAMNAVVDAGPAAQLLTPLKQSGQATPIFMVHPPGGIVLCYRELAGLLDADRPLYGIRSRGLHGSEVLPPTIEAMAADYLSAVRQVQPTGPYLLGGWSLGGLVAYEMAQQLLSAGEAVQQLILLDTTIPHQATDLVPEAERVNVGLEYGIELTLEELGELSPEEQLPMLFEHAQKLGVIEEDSSPEVIAQMLEDLQGLFHHHVEVATQYRMQPLAADIQLFRPQDMPNEIKVAHDRGWGYLSPRVVVDMVPGHHHSMVQSPGVDAIAAKLKRLLE